MSLEARSFEKKLTHRILIIVICSMLLSLEVIQICCATSGTVIVFERKNIIAGIDVGHVGVAIQLEDGTWIAGAIEGPESTFDKILGAIGSTGGGWYHVFETKDDVIREFQQSRSSELSDSELGDIPSHAAYDNMKTIEVGEINVKAASDKIMDFPEAGFSVQTNNDCYTNVYDAMKDYGVNTDILGWKGYLRPPIDFFNNLPGNSDTIPQPTTPTTTTPTTTTPTTTTPTTTTPTTTTPITTTPTTQSQSTIPTTTSQSTAVGALTPEQMDALIKQMQALEKTIKDYQDSGTGPSITPTPTTTTPTTTSPSTPATSVYASEIPVGGTQTKYFSTSNVPPGQVALSLDIKDENGNTVPVGTKVTIKDGSGNYVPADWASNGQTTVYGDPGNWIITVDAPGYNTNTQYIPVSSSVSGTSFKTDLQRAGVNNQPASISSPAVTQPAAGTPVPDSISSTSSNGQFTAKFIIPPGGQIKGTDGAGNPFQKTADSNGYVAILGSPGSWKITASAPGYEILNINNYQFSGTEVYGGNGYVDLAVQKVSASIETPVPAGTQAPISSVPVSGSGGTGISDTESVDSGSGASELDLGDTQLSVTQPVDTDLNSVPDNPDPGTRPTEISFGDTHLSVTQPVDTDLNSVQGNPDPDTNLTETSFGDTHLSVTQPVDTDLNSVQGNPDPDTKPTETSLEDTPLSVTQPVDTDLNSVQGNPKDIGNLVLTGNTDDTDYGDTGTTGHIENTKATNTNIFGQPVSIESTTGQIIPIGDTGTKHFSTTEYPSGSAMLSIDIRNENGNLVPAETVVTVRDGAGQEVQADWDSTGHALVSGAPGSWIITVNAPGYETNTQYATVSISPSPTNLRMNLNKNRIDLQPQASPFPASLPQINNPQPPENIQSGGLSQTEKDDILIDRLESLQGKGLSGDEVMNQLDEMQNQLDEQSS